jgi:hypothetical protein
MTEHMEQAAGHTIEMKGEIEVKFLPRGATPAQPGP